MQLLLLLWLLFEYLAHYAMMIPMGSMSSSHSISVYAYAKINLGLEVLFKRADGFHELNTVFVRISLADALVVSTVSVASSFSSDKIPSNSKYTPDISVQCSPALPIAETDNLAYKAACALYSFCMTNSVKKNYVSSDPEDLTMEYSHAGLRASRTSIVISKTLPLGGGLGGGSANAAAVLRACNELWQCGCDQATLLRIAATLGSDVPFFVLDVPCALGTSRGEVLQPFDLHIPYWIVLVCPGIHISTPWAYAVLSRTAELSTRKATAFSQILPDIIHQPELLREYIVNDFEPVVFAHHPVIANIRDCLYATGALFAFMSGSGSTMVGFYSTVEEATQASNHIRCAFDAELPDMQTFICTAA